MRMLRSRITLFALAAITAACGDRSPSGPGNPAAGERQSSGGGADTSHAKPDTTHTPRDTTHTPTPATKRVVSGTVLGVQAADSTQPGQPVGGVAITASVSMVVFDSTSAHHDSTIVTKTLGTATTDAAGKFSLPDMPTSGFTLTLTPPSDAPFRVTTAYVFPTTSATTAMTVYLFRK